MAEDKRYEPSALPGAVGLGGIGAAALYLGRRKITFLQNLIKMNNLFEEHLPMLKPERLDWVA